jgi:hypothetical protein
MAENVVLMLTPNCRLLFLRKLALKDQVDINRINIDQILDFLSDVLCQQGHLP